MSCICEEYVRLEPNPHEDCYDLVYYIYCDHMGSAEQEISRIPCIEPQQDVISKFLARLKVYDPDSVARELLQALREGRVPRVVVKWYSCPFSTCPLKQLDP